MTVHIREDVKNYFADFVCKGGTPPFTDKNVAKKSYGLGGTPPPALLSWRTLFTLLMTIEVVVAPALY